MSMAIGSKLQLEPGSWAETVYDVCIGAAVGAHHSFYMVSKMGYNILIRPTLQVLGIKQDTINTAGENAKALKVVAVGYGRTGTYSLKLALDDLGFPALHTQHLYEYQEIIDMWTNQIFLPSVRAKHASMGKPDFQVVLKHGFQATADLPMALYFEEILAEFPDCKFILTTRESSEKWFKSWDVLTKSITETTNIGGFVFSNVRNYSYYLRWLYSVINKDDSYLTKPFPLPHQNKHAAIASYEEHNARVRQVIPPKQLLEYNVNQGWEPLCHFLDISNCPDTPFPKTNSARSVQVQAVSAFLVPLIVVLFILFLSFAKVFQAMTGMTVVQWVNWKARELNLTLRKVMLGEQFDRKYHRDIRYQRQYKKM